MRSLQHPQDLQLENALQYLSLFQQGLARGTESAAARSAAVRSGRSRLAAAAEQSQQPPDCHAEQDLRPAPDPEHALEVPAPQDAGDQELLEGIGRLHVMTSSLQADLLSFIAEYDKRRLWAREGCRHMGQWLAGHLGVTVSEGLRWTTAAHALTTLPLIAAALRSGALSFDKVLQLARFASTESERQLLGWARRASVNAIRAKADLANRPSRQDTRDAHRERFLWWSWQEGGTRVGLEAMLPGDSGSAVIAAIEGLARSLPALPAEDSSFEQRCADALVTLCSAGTSEGPERPEVVLSAELCHLAGDGPGCQLGTGPLLRPGAVLHPELARRIACDCRLQVVVRDQGGRALGIGRRSRTVPEWLTRELLHRDGGCSFPGCGTRRFLSAIT